MAIITLSSRATNVVFEVRKVRARKADSAVTVWAGRIELGTRYISVITIQ